MKTYKHLFGHIVAFENLLRAARKARRGKSRRPDVAEFWLNLEPNLLAIQQGLVEGAYQFGGYRTFVIHEPKRRLISAAPFRDRVVHHALINVIGPLFERRFIHGSYANRVGKGTHRALRRVQGFVHRYRHIWKADIRSFFPSLDHEILYEKLCRVVACPETRWLLRAIIDGSNPQEPVVDYFPGDDLFTPHDRRRGLPIGNLTSQFWANVYLDAYDHFVKDELGIPAYARYVDDFVAADDSKQRLRELWDASAEFLGRERLRLHPAKTRIYRSREGIEFVGYHVRPDRVRVSPRSIRRFRFRMRERQASFASGEIGVENVRASVQGWLGHVRHADSLRMCEGVLQQFVFKRDSSW